MPYRSRNQTGFQYNIQKFQFILHSHFENILEMSDCKCKLQAIWNFHGRMQYEPANAFFEAERSGEIQ